LRDHEFLQLKVLVKHVLALAILIPLYVSSSPILLVYGDPEAKLSVLFPVLLVSLLFVNQLSKPSVFRFGWLANLFGGFLPIVSLFLPYSFSGSLPQYATGPGAVSQGLPHLILIGSLLTLFSKFGSIVTFGGLLDSYANRPMYFCSAFGCPPYVFGPGFWVAWAGLFVSLLGRSLIAFPKSVEGRKFLGSILFPFGLIEGVVGGLFASVWFNNSGPTIILVLIFTCTAFLLSGTGLNLYFELKSTTLTRIRRLLQKPLR
jgi:hypothetical protein